MVRDSLKDCIYSPQENKPVKTFREKVKLDREVVVFTLFGKHHDIDEHGYPILYDVEYEDEQIEYAEDSANAYAKVVYIRGKSKYYIKASSDGDMYNPIGLYEGGGKDTKRVNLGRPEWEFEEVRKRPFEFYINFLKTKNQAYLINAEREVR